MTEEKRARHRRYTLSKRILGPARASSARQHHRRHGHRAGRAQPRQVLLPFQKHGRSCRPCHRRRGPRQWVRFAEHAQPRCGIVDSNGFEAFIKHDMERSALLIKQGGMDSFSIKVKRLMFGAWKAILCDEGKEISPSASRPVTSTSSPAETRQTRVHRHRLKTVRHHFIAVMRSEEALHGADGLGAGQTVHPAIECRERHNRIHQEKRQQSPG